jgi:hypothetical protein
LLFNIFVRNLPDASHSQTVQFADDITNSEVGQDPGEIADKLTRSFGETQAFCKQHDLVINTAKTQFIVFKSARKKLPSDFEIILEGCSVKPATSVKQLGVTLDQHLTFGEHIDSIVSKCRGVLGVLRRSSPYLTRDLLRLAYIALVRSHLEYASAVFASASATQLRKLDTIQRIASRIISGSPSDAHSEPLLRSLRLDSLEKRRTTHIVSLVRAIATSNCHPALRSMFEPLADGTVRNNELHRIRFGRRRFSIFGKEAFNTAISSVH